MKKILLSMLLTCAFVTPVQADPLLETAIASPHRSEANKVRDNARHPYETLVFFGIKPTMTVVELWPGAGWYTEILAPYLRANGKLISAGVDPESSNDYLRKAGAEYRKKLATSPDAFDKVELGIFEPGVIYNFAKSESVDMVLTFRNLHNWVMRGEDKANEALKEVYKSLKPGGVFGIVDHRRATQLAANLDSGYLHEAYVIKLIEKAGFVLVEKSEINANPKDTTDYSSGVWSLPPALRNGEKDRALYIGIGESDRMTLKFIKPAAKK